MAIVYNGENFHPATEIVELGDASDCNPVALPASSSLIVRCTNERPLVICDFEVAGALDRADLAIAMVYLHAAGAAPVTLEQSEVPGVGIDCGGQPVVVQPGFVALVHSEPAASWGVLSVERRGNGRESVNGAA